MIQLQTLELFPYRVPLTNPVRLKGKAISAREGWLIKVTDNTGAEGYGEVAPLPGFSKETPAETLTELHVLRTSWPGRTVTEAALRTGLITEYGASVQFGLELALGELFAFHAGRILAEWLSPAAPPRPALNGLLAGDPAGFPAQAQHYRAAGFQAVKMKVGRQTVAEEVALVRAVHEVLGQDVDLRLDANQAWTFDQALAFAEGIHPCAVAYIEEPLQEPALLPALAEAWLLPIALDESAVALPVDELANHTYATAVVYKPMLAGGLFRALHLAEAAQPGMNVVISAAYETGVGILGLAALAAAVNTPNIPAGLDTYRWIKADVWHPRLDLSKGFIDLPSACRTPRTWNHDLLTTHA